MQHVRMEMTDGGPKARPHVEQNEEVTAPPELRVT